MEESDGETTMWICLGGVVGEEVGEEGKSKRRNVDGDKKGVNG